MSEPHENPPAEAPAAPASAPASVDLADQLRGFANETSALLVAIGGLASAEASLSLTALTRMVGLRVVGAVLLAFGVVLLAVAGTIALAHWLGSTVAALTLIGVVLSLGAAIALWRAKVWGARIGFAQTRAALGAKPAVRGGTSREPQRGAREGRGRDRAGRRSAARARNAGEWRPSARARRRRAARRTRRRPTDRPRARAEIARNRRRCSRARSRARSPDCSKRSSRSCFRPLATAEIRRPARNAIPSDVNGRSRMNVSVCRSTSLAFSRVACVASIARSPTASPRVASVSFTRAAASSARPATPTPSS